MDGTPRLVACCINCRMMDAKIYTKKGLHGYRNLRGATSLHSKTKEHYRVS